jgi:carbamoyl-phosphate synthase small subunit
MSGIRVNTPALLALEDGSLFQGLSIGAEGNTLGEVVFNTAMSGYQEILTDPSYCRQIVTLTCPHIGNTGVTTEDEESEQIHASGLIIRNLPARHSSWRSQGGLVEYLKERELVAMAGIDTRRLTRLIREKGALRGCIATGPSIDSVQAIEAARAAPGLAGADLARVVSTETAYEWRESTWRCDANPLGYRLREDQELPYRVIAYDFGVKRNILRLLTERGCRVRVVPAQTPVDEVLALKPDGIFLANGPGDPEPCTYAIEAITRLLEHKLPIFGICLGHQLLALAGGARTVKMKVGHHGANHPVQDIDSKQVLITSQNHGFAVDENSLPEHIHATHRSLFDGTLQGLAWKDRPFFGFQGHPEASPGPHDVLALFDQFVSAMAHAKNS